MTAGRSYRTNIEVLRDVLIAVRKPAPKTRIIGLANLNPHSLQEYLGFCTEHDLVGLTTGGYIVTRRGETVLDAIEVVLTKTTEFQWAVYRLKRTVTDHPVSEGVPGGALRHMARWAWKEILPNGANDARVHRSGGVMREYSTNELDLTAVGGETHTQDSLAEEDAETREMGTPTKGSPTGNGSRRTASTARPGR